MRVNVLPIPQLLNGERNDGVLDLVRHSILLAAAP
jgi:hypothetical protein